MRLQRLDVKGFKSFANETVVNFAENITGIVGPNGSGKSNIVDAIRWVLGEQSSRELRLDQMSSVIFNGTKKRKASGLAQVSLTFENTKNLLPTEYNSVTISRLLYRSGESEYRLNGVTCRLKDITSLFLDTGIGSNSYAIIALGMVDDILSDKENARRKMFEQAAGISKYKIRKREALNKLKNTTEDLERIEDLLYEIEKNLKTLEKQAKRTKKYFDLKAEYKELSIDLALLKIQSLKIQHQSIEQQLEKEQDRYRELDTQTTQLEAKLEAEKKGNLDKEKALSQRQQELNRLVGQIRSDENDKKMLGQKINFVEQNQEKLSVQIEKDQVRIRELEEEIDYYRTELNSEKRLEAELEEQLEATEKKLQDIRESHGSLKAELDAVVEQQQSIERKMFELEKQKAIHSNQIETYQKDLQRSAEEVELRKAGMSEVQTKLQELDTEENEQKTKLNELETAERNRKAELEKLSEQAEDIQQQLNKLNRQLDAKRNEYQLTKSMVDNFEGFPESIKFLSNHKNWQGQAPLLSDLIYVQEEYRVAIENYLDPYLNYYVVPTLDDAFQAIQLLSNAQKGKANFFILDAFKDYSPPVMLFPNGTQAIDLVETDPMYRNLCSYLLENVIVSESENYKEGLSENNIVLSKSGRIIRRKYSLSGGSIGLFEGKKIGRKKNLQVLSDAIKRLDREIDQLSSEKFSIKSRQDKLNAQRYDRQVQEQQNSINKLLQQKAALSTRLENFENYLEENAVKRSEIEATIQKLEASNQDIDQQLENHEQTLQQARQEISKADGSYREVAEQMSQASADFNEKNIAFIKQQNKVGSLQRELSFREKQLEETKVALANNRQTIDEGNTELETLRDDIIQLDEKLLKAYDDKKQRAATLTEAEQTYYQARGEINEIETALRKLNKTQQDTQSLINQLKDKFNDVKYKISSVAQRLRIEFNVQINDIINERDIPDDASEDEVEMKVEKLKNRLDNYGEINPMAVEAYDEMKERFETITQQRDDILQAKEDLLETIKEIEDTATTQFIEAFEQTRLYFIDVFRSLFTEDDACDLVLLEPENPLESKIEIVAKPKGKRPQTINQLSGGEKTLTATALLFALYLLKPAPFCIFDEVDAPLDDANVEKFNHIIKKFSENSQFIIVTHNKLTMAAVDVIYGVYMQEQGVSGVSPVDFRAFEHKSVMEAVQEAT